MLFRIVVAFLFLATVVLHWVAMSQIPEDTPSYIVNFLRVGYYAFFTLFWLGLSILSELYRIMKGIEKTEDIWMKLNS